MKLSFFTETNMLSTIDISVPFLFCKGTFLMPKHIINIGLQVYTTYTMMEKLSYMEISILTLLFFVMIQKSY